MRARSKSLVSKLFSLTVAGSFAAGSGGCVLSSMEVVNTDRVYLLGPTTQSEPGPATRTVSAKAVDTQGILAFHLDRARECTVISTPRYQKVHIEGREGKSVTGGIVTGALVTALAGGLIGASFALDNGEWFAPKFQGSTDNEVTDAGTLGITGVIVGIFGLILLPRSIYHGLASGTEATGGVVELGVPPKGAVRAPAGYDPKAPKTSLLFSPEMPVGPVAQQPAFNFLDMAPTGGLRRGRSAGVGASRSLPAAAPGLLSMPAGSSEEGGVSDAMRACVAKYTPACESKCKGDRSCVLTCLKKPCIDELDQEVAKGGLNQDEYTEIITKTEVCERRPDAGVALALVVKDTDGGQKILPLGKTDRNGNAQSDVVGALESAYPGWPASKQILFEEAQIVPVDEPQAVLGELELGKYPGLGYAEHLQSTRKAREAIAQAEAAKREREAKERQAMLEAAAKAQEDAAHAEERKAEAAKKAAACMQQAQSRCSGDCQGNQACVKKCMQKVSCR